MREAWGLTSLMMNWPVSHPSPAEASRVRRVAIPLVIGDQHRVVRACHNNIFPRLEHGVELHARRQSDADHDHREIVLDEQDDVDEVSPG